MPFDLHFQSTWQERLYRDKSASLILYGRALGLSHAEAEDVLHETFVTMVRLGDSPPKEPLFYCLRAYRNRAFNFKRGLLRRITRELESSRWFHPESSDSPQEHRAMHCLASLPQEQREVIVLKIWHGHTFEEIGRLLDISPNTAAGRHRYGMEKLRQCLRHTAHENTTFDGEPFAFLDTTPPLRGT